MTEPAAPAMHDLSDGDIVSRPLPPPNSLIAATGIAFHGLERSGPIPVQPWRDAGSAGETTPAVHGR
jgi:hypothetical protein